MPGLNSNQSSKIMPKPEKNAAQIAFLCGQRRGIEFDFTQVALLVSHAYMQIRARFFTGIHRISIYKILKFSNIVNFTNAPLYILQHSEIPPKRLEFLKFQKLFEIF